MSLGTRIFALSHIDISARSAESSSARVHRQSSFWTPAADEAEEVGVPG